MDQKDYNKEFEVDLSELIAVIFGKLWIIVMFGIVFMLVSFLVSKYAFVPEFESSTKIYVLNKQNNESAMTYGDLQTGTQLTKDYMTLVTSRLVIEQVIAEMGLDMSNDELRHSVTVTNPKDTRILEITVRHRDPFIAKKAADALRKVSEEHITHVMDIKQINLVEEANVPEYPVTPNIRLNIALGGVIGIVIASFLILLRFFMDDTIKTPEDVEKYLGLSVLSTIPLQSDMKVTNKKNKSTNGRVKSERRRRACGDN